MELKLLGEGGQDTSESITVSDTVLACPYNEGLVHQLVTTYRYNGRAGTRAQKTRADVRGGGRKPWKQKGTGRARAGTIRSPIWRGGGVTFAAKPKFYDMKINRKMYRKAMASILSELYRSDALAVMNDVVCESTKTRDLKQMLLKHGLSNVLIVVHEPNENLSRGAANLPHVEVLDAAHVNPISLLRYEKTLLTVPALRQLEERLA